MATTKTKPATLGDEMAAKKLSREDAEMAVNRMAARVASGDDVQRSAIVSALEAAGMGSASWDAVLATAKNRESQRATIAGAADRLAEADKLERSIAEDEERLSKMRAELGAKIADGKARLVDLRSAEGGAVRARQRLIQTAPLPLARAMQAARSAVGAAEAAERQAERSANAAAADESDARAMVGRTSKDTLEGEEAAALLADAVERRNAADATLKSARSASAEARKRFESAERACVDF